MGLIMTYREVVLMCANYARQFSPLTGKAVNNMPVFAFDTETEHVRSDFERKNGIKTKCFRQDFLLGSVVGDNGFQKVFYDKDEMADFLVSWKTRDALIYAHNLEFDFGILYPKRLDEFNLIHRGHLIAACKNESEKRIRHDRLKEGQVSREEQRKRCWTFLDTLNYANMSLERIGDKIVGKPKLPYPACMEKVDGAEGIIARRPKNQAEWDELEKYNVNDSLITYEFVQKFKEFCNLHNCRMKMTIASTGMDYWRRNHQKITLIKEKDDLLKKHFLGSFRGGITNVYKRGTYNGKLWYYDYKSSYPARMVEGVDGKGNYPLPNYHSYKTKISSEMIECYDGICEATVNAPYSYFPMLSWKEPTTGKLLNCYGSFKGWFTIHELRLAMKEGYEVTTGEGIIYYDKFKPFKEAVEYLYKLRQEYKAVQHPFEEMVKLFMNSGLFGKWGTNFLKMEEIFTEDKIRYDKDGRAFIDDKEISKYQVGSYLITVKKDNPKSPRYAYPILSEYTTMLGRIKLWSDCKDNGRHLCMNDTDSVLATYPCFENSQELGHFELQDTNDTCTTIRPKMYSMRSSKTGEWTTKSKGVGKFMKGHDKFYKALSDGYVDMSRFSKMKGSYRAGIMPGSIVLMRKKMGFEDDKRDWGNQQFSIDDWQDSNPLKVIDGLLPKDVMKAMNAYKDAKIKEEETYRKTDLFDIGAAGWDDPDGKLLYDSEKDVFLN